MPLPGGCCHQWKSKKKQRDRECQSQKRKKKERVGMSALSCLMAGSHKTASSLRLSKAYPTNYLMLCGCVFVCMCARVWAGQVVSSRPAVQKRLNNTQLLISPAVTRIPIPEILQVISSWLTQLWINIILQANADFLKLFSLVLNLQLMLISTRWKKKKFYEQTLMWKIMCQSDHPCQAALPAYHLSLHVYVLSRVSYKLFYMDPIKLTEVWLPAVRLCECVGVCVLHHLFVTLPLFILIFCVLNPLHCIFSCQLCLLHDQDKLLHWWSWERV